MQNTPTLQRSTELTKVLDFLEEIGIPVLEKTLTDTFLPGLALGPSCIYVDFEQLLYPGDLLHEAGHLAVTTPDERKLAGTEAQSTDWPSGGEEIGAILWSYAAAVHLNLPLDFVFHNNGYKNGSEMLISNFEQGNYIGLPFLEWAGLCLSVTRAEQEGEKPFPFMLHWIRR